MTTNSCRKCTCHTSTLSETDITLVVLYQETRKFNAFVHTYRTEFLGVKPLNLNQLYDQEPVFWYFSSEFLQKTRWTKCSIRLYMIDICNFRDGFDTIFDVHVLHSFLQTAPWIQRLAYVYPVRNEISSHFPVNPARVCKSTDVTASVIATFSLHVILVVLIVSLEMLLAPQLNGEKIHVSKIHLLKFSSKCTRVIFQNCICCYFIFSTVIMCTR